MLQGSILAAAEYTYDYQRVEAALLMLFPHGRASPVKFEPNRQGARLG